MFKILVTGGAGFIGSHTCLTLLSKGYDVVVIDNFINSSKSSLSNVIQILNGLINKKRGKLQIFEGDLRDFNFINNIFVEEKKGGFPIGGVIHFAGLKAVRESMDNPLLYWDINLLGTINLLKSMDKNKCRTLVFSSSATVYGNSKYDLINEKSLINPINPYGNTKASIEKLLGDIFKSNIDKWSISNLRYFNPIGAHKSGLIGENPIGKTNNIFPLILKVASGEKAALKIFGNNWPTSDGTCVRDYIHVMDIAEGHMACLEYLFTNKSQLISLNLGTGKGTTVLELVNTFQNINNIKIPYVITKRREGDVARIVADNQLAKKLINWRPKRNIKLMCKDGWNWKNKNPNGYQ